MKNLFVNFLCLIVVALFFVSANAQQKQSSKAESQKHYEPIVIEQSPELQTLLNNAVGETINDFLPKKISSDNIAATLIDLRTPKNLRTANYRGNQKIYPASVVKLFYMAALEQWLENGNIKMSPELAVIRLDSPSDKKIRDTREADYSWRQTSLRGQSNTTSRLQSRQPDRRLRGRKDTFRPFH